MCIVESEMPCYYVRAQGPVVTRTWTRTKTKTGMLLMSNGARESSKQIKVRCALKQQITGVGGIAKGATCQSQGGVGHPIIPS